MLIPAPYYGSYLLDLQLRSRVIPFPVDLSSKVGKLFLNCIGARKDLFKISDTIHLEASIIICHTL